ncbi:MAG: electron transfer flavoprotein subunit alpha/FixB family protein, partial [Acidobacteria bacterium]|nr:electron transfer flavoprotein subunit alpha/FixB family protein [Acidobacteriota bacterium]
MSGVLVVLEQRDGAWNRMSFEALAAGQQLAAKLGIELSAAVVGDSVQSLPWETDVKPKIVYAVEHALLKQYTADGFTAALEQLIEKVEPAFVFFPHTYQVRDFAPALATRFQQVLISDVIAIHDGPVFVRQLLQGKLNA